MNGPESIFYKLLLKKISGALTEEEKLLLADLLKAYPEFSEAYETVQWLWNESAVSSPSRPAERSKRLLERNMQQLEQQGLLPEQPEISVNTAAGKSKARRYFFMGAGILFLVIACVALLFPQQPDVKETMEKRFPNMVITRPGSRTKLILPDGTTVWLNASSKLTYGDDFLQKERRVQLDGEAFFEVVKNEGKPFIINTAVMDVRVLGTSLNVKSYPGEKKAEAVLIRGKIEVQVKRRPQERYLLSSYEKLSIAASPDIHPHKELSISSVAPSGKDSVIAETAWVDNELVFKGEPLSELAVRMERWFGLRITVTGTRLQSFRMTGAFKDDSPEEALKAISIITGCKYRIKDHTAVLYDAN
ncbi:FecR domain-containing protein [uncultured Chitinophaga sp.]|jgi:Fe2+-dicitrate sensor, membrane component|uniref:FecR family protein n=1 Tax=uncultured Chitinophaga sp. TaxID=339340 RepID=UPI00263904A5|nr:FecR domain-containing protein [uncultured Chitinophaga sp.]